MSVVELEPIIVEPVESVPDPVTQALIDTKAYIEEHGWQAKGGDGPHGEACIAVALGKTQRQQVGRSIIISRALYRVSVVIGGFVAGWNDAPGRTVEEVYQALDSAIAQG